MESRDFRKKSLTHFRLRNKENYVLELYPPFFCFYFFFVLTARWMTVVQWQVQPLASSSNTKGDSTSKKRKHEDSIQDNKKQRANLSLPSRLWSWMIECGHRLISVRPGTTDTGPCVIGRAMLMDGNSSYPALVQWSKGRDGVFCIEITFV